MSNKGGQRALTSFFLSSRRGKDDNNPPLPLPNNTNETSVGPELDRTVNTDSSLSTDENHLIGRGPHQKTNHESDPYIRNRQIVEFAAIASIITKGRAATFLEAYPAGVGNRRLQQSYFEQYG